MDIEHRALAWVVGGALRIGWERRRALGCDGSSPLGVVALAVGYPLYGAARLRSSIARRRRARTPKEPA
jgi:hypothetical protein